MSVDWKILGDSTKYKMVKRVAAHPLPNMNDIYITRDRHIKAYEKRIMKLLFVENEKEIRLHALGAAIPIAVSLALYIRDTTHDSIIIGVNTKTVTIYDEFQPLVNDLPVKCVTRNNSAITIRLIKKS